MKGPSAKMPRRDQHIIVYLVSLLLSVPAFFPLSIQPTRARAQGPEFTTESTAGDLDPNFGNGGKVLTDFSGNDDVGSAVGIESDGKIVVGGTSTSQGGNSDFAE
jgi:hypothetical protein